MLAPPLADFLRSRRADCNARFAAARRRWPRLSADEFSLFLRDQLSPFASTLVESAPAHAPLILTAAYDLGLQLVAEKLAGPSARLALFNALWTDLFPRLAPLAATAPRRLLGSLVNATIQLADHSDTRANDWLARLGALGPSCASADHLLALSQVIAWRAGLAHYRASALAAADGLPPALALAALDAPKGADWPEVRAAHERDPWFGYAPGGASLPGGQLHRRVGAFRGFGGLFLVPPSIARVGETLIVRSSDETWILVADCFGATFHRATPEEFASARPAPAAPALANRLPSGQIASSAALNLSTYAIATAQSHSLWIGSVAHR